MDIYYFERALTDAELVACARILAGMHVPGVQSPPRQRRVPGLFPQPAPGARPGLPGYVPLLGRHLRKIGLAPRWRQCVAMLLLPDSPLSAALALALREASGLAPYIILRAHRPGGPLRVIDPGPLLDVLAPLGASGPSPRASWPAGPAPLKPG